MRTRPFFKQVVGLPSEKPTEQVLESGLVIPNPEARQGIVLMKVVAVGKDCQEAKEGMMVLVPPFVGSFVVLTDDDGVKKTFLAVEEDNIMAEIIQDAS